MKRYKKYLHYYQFAQSIPISYRVERNAKRTKFQQVQPHCNFNFIPIVCTSTSNVILMCKDFEIFYTFMDFIKPLETYAIETYPNLVNFVISLSVFRKGLSFGPRHEPPTSWRLGQEE
jgi:hypothetical protein